jgi:hypothetical protein
MEAPVPSATEVSQLLTTLNSVKFSVLVLLAIFGAAAGLMYGGFKLLVMALTAKAERERRAAAAAAEREHQATMKSMQETINANTLAMKKQLSEHRRSADRNESVLDTVFAAVESTNKNVDILLRLQQGCMRPEDAAIVMRWLFIYRVRSEVSSLLRLTFGEKHYHLRSTHVQRKVKTKMAEIIAAVQSEVSRLKVPNDTGPYFPSYLHNGGMRYTLCDTLWDQVAPVFERSKVLDGSSMSPEVYAMQEAKIIAVQSEEMEVILQNALEDHVTRAAATVEAESRNSTAMFRTPAPIQSQDSADGIPRPS